MTAAVGDIHYNQSLYGTVRLLVSASADTAVPTLVTDGADISKLGGANYKPAPVGTILVSGTGATPTMKAKLWGYNPELGVWVPVGVSATVASIGDLNGGNAFGGEVTNKVLHAEAVQYVGHFTRLYLQIHGSSGLTAIDALLIVPRVTQLVDK